jgi:hypothetical protein
LVGKIPEDIRFKRGLLHAKHIVQLGPAFPLYVFFLDRQTNANGLVWYGRPITYDWISDELGGFAERTLRRWNGRLQRRRYIAVQLVMYGGMRVQILRPKKYAVQARMAFQQPVENPVENLLVSPFLRRPHLADGSTKSGRTKDTVKERETRKSGADAASGAAACGNLRELQGELARLEASLAAFAATPGLPDTRVDPDAVRRQIRDTQIKIDYEIENLRRGNATPRLATEPAAAPANPVARFEDVIRNDEDVEGDRQGRLEFLQALRDIAAKRAM